MPLLGSESPQEPLDPLGAAAALAAIEVAWKPHPGPQTTALACPVPELFYGGARGGGKSDFLLGDFAQQAAVWGSRAKGLLLRRSYKELDEIVARSHEIYPKLGARFYWSLQDFYWEFPATDWDLNNGVIVGATLKLRAMEKNAEAAKYQGHSYTWIGVDEAGNFPSAEPIDLLRATLRTPHLKDGLVPLLRLTGNPGGVGHVWLKERYIDPAPQGFVPVRYQPQPELLPDVWAVKVFIPSKVQDNLSLDVKAYTVNLAAAAQGNRELLKAWLLGDWDVFVGQAFWEWSREAHVVPNTIQHLAPRFGWRWVAALDWGVRKGCYLLAAISPEGDIEIVLSLVLAKMDARTAAAWVARKTGLFPMPEWIFTGHDMRQTSVDRGGKSLEELWRRGMMDVYGKNLDQQPRLKIVEHGKGSRAVKYSLMHEHLRWRDERDELGRLQPWARPKLRVQERCGYLIQTIPALPVDPDAPEEDVDTESDDHGYDACCNLLLARAVVERPEPEVTPQDRAPGFDVSEGVDGGRRKGKRKSRRKTWRRELQAAQRAARQQDEGWHAAQWDAIDPDGLVELEDF